MSSLTTKIRDAVRAGIMDITHEFNKKTFPQMSEEWTPEQLEIFKFLNGESGGITAIHESHRGEITRNLTRIAGIDGLKSIYTMTDSVAIPPFATVVLRENLDGYPAGFPLIKSRIWGMWTEKGQGKSTDIVPYVKQMRPATDDDVHSIVDKFPADRLCKLYGSIPFPEKKLRAALAERVQGCTAEFEKSLNGHYPEGISEKGLAILQAAGPNISAPILKALSIVLDDPHMLEPFNPPARSTEFAPWVAVVFNHNENGMCYELEQVHVQAGVTPSDTFFTYPGEWGEVIGNHASGMVETLRVATPDEIKDYFTNVPKERLYLYPEMLTEEQMAKLI